MWVAYVSYLTRIQILQIVLDSLLITYSNRWTAALLKSRESTLLLVRLHENQCNWSHRFDNRVTMPNQICRCWQYRHDNKATRYRSKLPNLFIKTSEFDHKFSSNVTLFARLYHKQSVETTSRWFSELTAAFTCNGELAFSIGSWMCLSKPKKHDEGIVLYRLVVVFDHLSQEDNTRSGHYVAFVCAPQQPMVQVQWWRSESWKVSNCSQRGRRLVRIELEHSSKKQ